MNINKNKPESKMNSSLFGRCLYYRHPDLVLLNQWGEFKFVISDENKNNELKAGDLIHIQVSEDSKIQILTSSQNWGTINESNRSTHSPISGKWTEHVLNPRRRQALKIRSQVENSIRSFFIKQDFLEVRTPLLVPCPGMEPHIKPFLVKSTHSFEDAQSYFLPTSPEFAMKRLLVGGLEKIFQICPAFRDEPTSKTHQPEFTLLEWYQAYTGFEQIMKDTEEMFSYIAHELFGKPKVYFQGNFISVNPPWPRLKIKDLFLEFANVDLLKANTTEALREECIRLKLIHSSSQPPSIQEDWDDLYFKIWLNLIEPQLPSQQAVFVTHYPPSQAALSVISPDENGNPWAKRFEVYAGGFELGNAFEELTQPLEQRRRFIKDMELRKQVYGERFPANPLDEDFLASLEEGMPPSSGIAMGVDRIAMLFANEPDIDFIQWIPVQKLLMASSVTSTQ